MLPNFEKKLLQIFLDSACSAHMTLNAKWLVPSTIRKILRPVNVHLGDNSVLEGIARGTMRFEILGHRHLKLTKMLLVPQLATTLISIPALAQAGFNSFFDRSGEYILCQSKRIPV